MRKTLFTLGFVALIVPLAAYAGKGGPPPPPATGVIGSLDAATCSTGTATGWAEDQNSPNEAVNVYFWIDSTPPAYDSTSGSVGLAIANEYRADLCQSLGSCYHAFTFAIPSGYLDGQNHNLYAYGRDTTSSNGTALSGVPKSFTCAPPPTCTVAFDENPIQYGDSTTVHWNSTLSTSVYINTIGYVTPNQAGSATVSTGGDYTCTATGTDTTRTYAAALTVVPPANPSVSITADSDTLPLGASTTITATFQSNPLDPIVQDNIDYPAGTGLASSSDPDTSKTVTFTPTAIGVYDVLARAITGYFYSWTTFATTTVTAVDAPACTISFDENPIPQGSSTTIHWSSSGADTFSINAIGSVPPNTSSSALISPSQATDYTGTVTKLGYPFYCMAATGDPAGTLNVSCTAAYSCSDTQTILYTDENCETTETSCTLPAFCSAGSSTCLYPSPEFNQSGGGLTGHLQVSPQVLHTGTTTIVNWSVSYVAACTVTGDNGDSWTGSSGTKTSKPIVQQTTYTLSCTGLDGSHVSETAVVNILPKFQEK